MADNESDSFPTVSKFKLRNDGGFVVDIHAIYRSPQSSTHTEVANRDNFPIAQTRTMNLAEKCTKPPIAKGDLVQMKVWVAWGHDNTYGGIFLYDDQGDTQLFKISGATLDNSLEYLGPEK